MTFIDDLNFHGIKSSSESDYSLKSLIKLEQLDFHF